MTAMMMSSGSHADVRVREAHACLERSDTVQAELLLSAVLAEAPEDARALQLMGQLCRRQNRLAEAEDYYRHALAINAAEPRLHHQLGNLLAALSRFDEAVASEREAIRLKQNFADAHLGLAVALSCKGDHAAAEKSYRDALRLQPNYYLAKLGLAAELNSLDRPLEAERVLRHEVNLGIRDPNLLAAFEVELGTALTKQRKYAQALALFAAAQSRAPGISGVEYRRGACLQQLGRYEEAADWFRAAVAREPGHTDARAYLAVMTAQLGDFATAFESGSAALVREPDHPIALIALAIAEIETNGLAAAEEKLCRILANLAHTGDPGVAFAASFAADACERRGQTAEAFTIYQLCNARLRELYAAEFESARAIADVERRIAWLSNLKHWKPTEIPSVRTGEPLSHVFLLGFMRSGTTLLETILATSQKVVHADEVYFLAGAERALLSSDDGLKKLNSLDEGEIARARGTYWKSVQQAGFSVDGKVFVDKMPFNSLRLPLIARLFPSAKIIFAVRDPRDVAFSCFRRRFNPTHLSYEFYRLDDCVHFYAQVMTFVDLCREKLPLRLHQHRYEDMIHDFESSSRAVCDFIGLDWSDRMRDFQAAAESIDRRSASAEQVRRGLFAEGVGQWRRYRAELAPLLPVLAPWAARFGYPAE